ncbi:MAG: hypothetical protein JO047_15505, partial [Alphaproteobacteria bacterium]|nr:hypothetical protein [Alphaproteobacteria bacterium]
MSYTTTNPTAPELDAPPIAVASPAGAELGRGGGYWKAVGQRLGRDPVTIAVTVILLAIVFLAVAAPLVAGADPYAGGVLSRLKPIGTPGHWLGTDETGRDLWARLC